MLEVLVDSSKANTFIHTHSTLTLIHIRLKTSFLISLKKKVASLILHYFTRFHWFRVFANN